eukprot:817694-Karenia_brevis.AAC.1
MTRCFGVNGGQIRVDYIIIKLQLTLEMMQSIRMAKFRQHIDILAIDAMISDATKFFGRRRKI